MKRTYFHPSSGRRLRAWRAVWLMFLAAMLPISAAEEVDLASWGTEAAQALGDGDEARLVGLIERLTPETGRQVLGEVPIRAAEAGWTNALARLLGKGLLTLPKAPESAAGSGPGPRFGLRPNIGDRMSPSMGPPWFVTATEVLAVAARIGKIEVVRQMLVAGTDSHGPMRMMGSAELPPVLNAMRVPAEMIPSTVRGRSWVTGSREDRRLCLDLLLRYGATLSPTNEASAMSMRGNPAGDLAGMSRFLDPELLDYTLTNSRPVTRVDSQGRGLVHLAVGAGRAAVIGPLVAQGAAIDQRDGNSQTPLQLLASRGGVDPLSSSNSQPGLPGGATGYIYRPDPELVRSNRIAVATALLQSGARHDVFSAAGLDDTNALAAILQANPTAHSQTNHYRQTPLHWAVQNVSVRAVAQLLAAGANPNAQDMGGPRRCIWPSAGGPIVFCHCSFRWVRPWRWPMAWEKRR